MNYLPVDAHIGERIRYYRKKKGMTQKALADLCGLSEAAIRNYELGNRTPDRDTIMDISAHLEVSYHSINDPDLLDIFGALHILFRMEEIYGIHPEVNGSKVQLTFENTSLAQALSNSDAMLAQTVKVWEQKYKLYKKRKISKEEYEDWKSKFPEFAVLSQFSNQTKK